jgi:hypothetical protein
MSIRTLQQAFEEFERDKVRVPEAQNRAAKQVQEEFRRFIARELGHLHADDFLAGSYRRRTQAVELKDLDIVFVLNDPTGEFLASALATLKQMKHVATKYGPVTIAKVKCRAVECELDGYTFWVDFVPALPDGHARLLLAYNDKDENTDEWRPADPKGQIDACFAKNDQTGHVYIPVTRICKFWNRSFVSSPDQKKPLPSYLVEAILYDALSGPCEWADAVLAFFENAERHLSNPQPSVACPGSPQDFVDEKLEDDRRRDALAKVQAALVHARAAAASPDPRKAMDQWAQVFGPGFPAPCTQPGRLAQGLRTGSATVVGSSVTASPLGRSHVPVRSHGPARP